MLFCAMNLLLDQVYYAQYVLGVLMIATIFKVNTGNSQFLLILAAPLDKSSSDTSACCPNDLC